MIAGLITCANIYFANLFAARWGTDAQKPMLVDEDIPGTCAGCSAPFSQAVVFGVKSKVATGVFLAIGVYCMFSALPSAGDDIVGQCAATSSIDIDTTSATSGYYFF